ncbi:hypothetical protein, partial [uncultured Jannaschia sp.]|uniref:hypothetical protein n=1 Tax=uncultured Jannaschia sp. TaxID=293347 RepID=UPI00260C019C
MRPFAFSTAPFWCGACGSSEPDVDPGGLCQFAPGEELEAPVERDRTTGRRWQGTEQSGQPAQNTARPAICVAIQRHVARLSLDQRRDIRAAVAALEDHEIV